MNRLITMVCALLLLWPLSSKADSRWRRLRRRRKHDDSSGVRWAGPPFCKNGMRSMNIRGRGFGMSAFAQRARSRLCYQIRDMSPQEIFEFNQRRDWRCILCREWIDTAIAALPDHDIEKQTVADALGAVCKDNVANLTKQVKVPNTKDGFPIDFDVGQQCREQLADKKDWAACYIAKQLNSEAFLQGTLAHRACITLKVCSHDEVTTIQVGESVP